jgi:hypothetical protein
MGRSYTLGLAIGSLWLIVAAVGCSITVLALMDMQAATVVLAAVLAGAVVVATGAVFVIRAAARLPKDTASAKSGPTMRRWFIIVFAVEVALIVVVAWVCATTRHFEYIVPLDLVIVGAHFLPLAWLFGVPRYNVLGAGFCAIAIAVMLMKPHRTGAMLRLDRSADLVARCSRRGRVAGLRESWRLARNRCDSRHLPPATLELGIAAIKTEAGKRAMAGHR